MKGSEEATLEYGSSLLLLVRLPARSLVVLESLDQELDKDHAVRCLLSKLVVQAKEKEEDYYLSLPSTLPESC